MIRVELKLGCSYLKGAEFFKVDLVLILGFLGIMKKNGTICFIIQKPISSSKNSKLNKHVVIVPRSQSVSGSVGFMLED